MTADEAIGVTKRLENQDRSLQEPNAVADAIETACAHWAATLGQVEMPGQLGAADWKGFELRIWQLGESLRVFLKKKKAWHGRGPILDVVATLLLDPGLGKGRQTFALVLGEFGGHDYGSVLGRVLDDEEVRGHAVKALTKAKVAGFAAEVAAIQAQERGWIRAAATKYLQNVGW